MCGIFLYSSKKSITGKEKKWLKQHFQKLKHRGPDQSEIRYYGHNTMMGFHRLAIMDPTNQGIQPFESEDQRFIMMINGEIYNFRELEKVLLTRENKIKNETRNRSDLLKTHSDCEIVVHLFTHLLNKTRREVDDSLGEKEKKFKETVQIFEVLKTMCSKYLNGEFALTMLDQKTQNIYFAVDELSVRPLFIGRKILKGSFFNEENKDNIKWEWFLSSEQKAIPEGYKITRIPSSSIGFISEDRIESVKYGYFSNVQNRQIKTTEDISFLQAATTLKELLIKNVKNKLNPEREFGFLLSGGLDSSLICSIASKILNLRIKTFTVGFSEDATDIKAARLVAKHIDSIHHEFICSYKEGLDMIERVIEYSETWDQTSVRASIPMSLCLKKAKELYPDLAVIYSGEVADELLMGYLYNLESPSLKESRLDQIKRLEDLYMFDGLRADRVCSSYSTELRLPFFSKELLEFVLTLPTEYISPLENEGIEKYILRYAFSDSCILDSSNSGFSDGNYLPESILWRSKNAFSDATSIVGKTSWKEILKALAEKKVTNSRFSDRNKLYPSSTPQTKEDFYYRELFEEYGYNEKCIKYKWLPSWVEGTDSSASMLKVFKETIFK